MKGAVAEVAVDGEGLLLMAEVAADGRGCHRHMKEKKLHLLGIRLLATPLAGPLLTISCHAFFWSIALLQRAGFPLRPFPVCLS